MYFVRDLANGISAEEGRRMSKTWIDRVLRKTDYI